MSLDLTPDAGTPWLITQDCPAESAIITSETKGVGIGSETHGSIVSLSRNASVTRPELGLPFTIPMAERAELARLPVKVNQDLELKLGALRQIHGMVTRQQAPLKLHTACGIVARGYVGEGFSQVRLKRLYMDYMEGGRNWRSVLNKKAAGAAFWQRSDDTCYVKDKVAFRKFVTGLCENYQVVNQNGYRELIHIWRTHYSSDGKTRHPDIPGYEQWPQANPATGLPYGWSFRNLARLCAPDPFDATACREGLANASEFRPPVLRSRKGLRIGQYIECDDHPFNVQVHFPGQRNVYRPASLAAIDVLSDCVFAHGYKPTLWSETEQRKKVLNETDAMWFVVHLLCDHGYRTDEVGTTIVVENATMTVSEEFAERISRVTGQKVKVVWTGMFKHAAHGGQFPVRGKGNPKAKPHIERAFALVDSRISNLPGQMGRSYEHCPAELDGRARYTRGLLKDSEKLSLEQASMVQLPVATWSEFVNRAMATWSAVNDELNHQLEGWEECGFLVKEFRLQPTEEAWQDMRLMEAMTDAQRAAVQALIGANEAAYPGVPFTRARKLSRMEAWRRGQRELTRIQPIQYCQLMGLENGVECTVEKNHLVKVEKSTERYLAPDNFRPGEKYLGFVNPFSPRYLLCCRPDGAAVAVCELWDRVSIADEHAQQVMMGKQNHWVAERVHAIQARHAPEAAAREHMLQHNAAVLEGRLLSEAEEAKLTEEDRLKQIGDAAFSAANL